MIHSRESQEFKSRLQPTNQELDPDVVQHPHHRPLHQATVDVTGQHMKLRSTLSLVTSRGCLGGPAERHLSTHQAYSRSQGFPSRPSPPPLEDGSLLTVFNIRTLSLSLKLKVNVNIWMWQVEPPANNSVVMQVDVRCYTYAGVSAAVHTPHQLVSSSPCVCVECLHPFDFLGLPLSEPQHRSSCQSG